MPAPAACALVSIGVVAGMLAASPAAAATTYRCDVDGRTLYSDVPCPAGRQSTIEAADPVSAADRAAAASRLKTDKATLAQIERDRERQRKDDLRAAALDRKRAQDTKKHAQSCAALARRARNAHDAFDLSGPRDQSKLRLKMQRADEDYAAQCKP